MTKETHVHLYKSSLNESWRLLLSSLKRSRDFLLYIKKEMSRVLSYDNTWLLLLPPRIIYQRKYAASALVI